jgi:hypothetical protein
MSDSTNRSNSYLEKASPTVTKLPRKTKHFILTPSSTLASYTASGSRLLRRQLHLIQQRRGHETQRSSLAHGFSNGLTMIATAGTSHQTQRRNLQQKTSAIRTTQDNGLAIPQQQLQQRHNRTKSSQPSINDLVNSSILSKTERSQPIAQQRKNQRQRARQQQRSRTTIEQLLQANKPNLHGCDNDIRPSLSCDGKSGAAAHPPKPYSPTERMKRRGNPRHAIAT